MTTREQWKPVKNYEGLYEVSNLGNVRSLFRYKKHLKTLNHISGYKTVNLYKNKKLSSKRVHILVADAFIPNPVNKGTVNHIDGNKHNNCVDNLEWNTIKENIHNAIKTGLYSNDNLLIGVKSIDKNGNETLYNYLNEASNITGIDKGNILKVLKGKRKTAGGLSWAYI